MPERTMSNDELVEACRKYYEGKQSLKYLGKRINNELDAQELAQLITHDGKNYAVSAGSFDGPLYQESRVPGAD